MKHLLLYLNYLSDMLTTQEQATLKLNEKQEQWYIHQQLLSIKEQVSLDLFANQNEYQRVASLVDAPILDEINALYKVDGINVSLLFNTLNLHKRFNRTLDNKKEESWDYADKNDREWFATYDLEIWHTIETFSQTKSWLICIRSQDKQWLNDESIQDIVWQKQYREHALNKKISDTKKTIMFNLDNLWKDYNKHQKELDVVVWARRQLVHRQMKSVFNKIKWLEWLLEKLNEWLKQNYFKCNIKPQIDNLLSRYVSWQQKQLSMGNEPQITREDAMIKSWFKKHLSLYNKNV